METCGWLRTDVMQCGARGGVVAVVVRVCDIKHIKTNCEHILFVGKDAAGDGEAGSNECRCLKSHECTILSLVYGKRVQYAAGNNQRRRQAEFKYR